MLVSTLDVLRCPYCGGRLELVITLPHRSIEDHIQDGILGCQCCIFPVVDGIPVLHLQQASTDARAHIEAGRPDLALRVMVGVDDPKQAEALRGDRFGRGSKGSPQARPALEPPCR